MQITITTIQISMNSGHITSSVRNYSTEAVDVFLVMDEQILYSCFCRIVNISIIILKKLLLHRQCIKRKWEIKKGCYCYQTHYVDQGNQKFLSGNFLTYIPTGNHSFKWSTQRASWKNLFKILRALIWTVELLLIEVFYTSLWNSKLLMFSYRVT